MKNLIYPAILAVALVALGIGFSSTNGGTGEKSTLSYDGNLWCVSNYIEQEPTEYLKDGRPAADEDLRDKMDWIRKEQVEADSKEEAEEKAKEAGRGLFEPSEKVALRQALKEDNKEFFTTHFNTGATSPGPCLGGGSSTSTAGKWLSDGINEDCFGITTSSGNCEVKSERIELIGKGIIDMPASGEIVQESHLVTKEENFQPSSISDRIEEHYKITQEAIGATFSHNSKWTPAEGGGNIGQGSASPPPASVEPWVMNMYWKSRPNEGTRVIITNPANGKSVVAAAGYETGPSTKYLFGAQEEVMQALGVQTGSTVTVGFAVDQSLPFGPIECKTADADSSVASSSTSNPTGSGQTIVIDPGHGSAINRSDHEDKIMLEIGLKLKQKLISSGYKVVMTRTTNGQPIGGVKVSDTYQDNVQRAIISNNTKPAIVIRLHSNSHSSDRFEIVYPDKVSSDRKGKQGPPPQVVRESTNFAKILSQTLKDSGRTGTLLPETSYDNSPTKPRGKVLVFSAHTQYPVVTYEIYGHVSSSLKNKYSQANTQNNVAEQIVKAVKRYVPLKSSHLPIFSIAHAVPPEDKPKKVENAPEYCPDEPLKPGPSTGEDYQMRLAKEFEASHSIATGGGTGGSTDLAGLGIAPGNADAIVAVARSQVGYQGKGNCTIYDGCAQWCAYFATWVYREAGFDMPHMGGSKATLDWFKNNGHYTTTDPSAIASSQPGDIIVWSRKGGGHIGIITENNQSAGTVKIVEGNTSGDRVKEYTRTYESAKIPRGQTGFYGIGRWKE